MVGWEGWFSVFVNQMASFSAFGLTLTLLHDRMDRCGLAILPEISENLAISHEF